MATKPHVDDVGTALDFTFTQEDGTAIDLSLAIDYSASLIRPDGTAVEIAQGDFTVLDAAAGRVRYLTVADDLSIAGIYRTESHVTTVDGAWTSNADDFRVYPNLE